MGNNVKMNVKTCTKCGEIKPPGDYYRRAASPDGLTSKCKLCTNAANKEWAQQNRVKMQGYRNKWAADNPEKAAAATKRYRNRPEAQAKKRTATREWWLNNQETKLEHSRKWKRTHKQKVNALNQKRKAQKNKNGVFAVTDKDLARLYASPCAACGSTDQITADHVIPIARGGRHSIGNLQPLCLSCNASKRDRLMVEWQAA